MDKSSSPTGMLPKQKKDANDATWLNWLTDMIELTDGLKEQLIFDRDKETVKEQERE